MKIKKYGNTTKEEVDAKKFNIWIGVSLGNKHFVKENIQKYIKWAIEHTKKNVLVVVADAIHAINLEILDNRTRNGALNRALKLGEQKYLEIKDILNELPEDMSEKVYLVRWNDIVDTDHYKNNLKIIKDEFKNNQKFYSHIIELVKQARKDRKSKLKKLSQKDIDRLAEYILNELPLFVNGVQGRNDTVYTLIPYPGFTKPDELFIGLQNKEVFPELAKKLNITNKIQILDAWVD